MAKGLIAIAQYHDCETCINRTEAGKCKFRDSVKLNLRMEGSFVLCGLYKEKEKEA